MTYALKMARAAAPAIDRAARRLHDGGYWQVMDSVFFAYRNTQIMVDFGTQERYEIAAGVLCEELRADGFGWSTTYDNNNARTGKLIGLRVTHPSFLTRHGDEVRNRPDTWRLEGPMPEGNVYLDAETIERLAQEAAEVVRDMLRLRSLDEHGKLPPGTYDLPPMADNPLETSFDREIAEHNDEPVQAIQPIRATTTPSTLAEAFGVKDDDTDD